MIDFEIWVSKDDIKTPVINMTDKYVQNVISHLEKDHEKRLAAHHEKRLSGELPKPSPWIDVMYNELQRRLLSRAPKSLNLKRLAREERERCAALCDKAAELLNDSVEKHVARDLADQIRALPNLDQNSE